MRLLRVLQQFSISNVISFVGFACLLYISIISVRSWQTLVSYFEISDSLATTLMFWLTILLHPGSNFDWLSMLVLVAFSLLAAFQVVLWFKIYRRQRQSLVCPPTNGTSRLTVLGGLVAIIGIGCAACGATLLLSFLGLFSLTGLLLVLPLHGVEIGFLGIGILLYTSHRLIKVW
jgi:hypothetical protein